MQQSSVVKKYLLLSGLLLILIANIAYGEESLFVYSEFFSTDTYKDPAKTTADWNLEQKVVQLSKDNTGNTKQVKGDVAILGAFQYYCWIDFRGGLGDNNGHVYMQKFNSTGVKQWAADVQVDSVYSGTYIADNFNSDYPKLITDGTYIYVYWVHNANLFLQKFDTNGRLWNNGDLQVNEATVTVTNNSSGYYSAVINSANQLVFFWSSGTSIYMQKLNPNVADYMQTAKIGNSTKIVDSSFNIVAASNDSADNYYVAYSSGDSIRGKIVVCLDKFPSTVSQAGDRLWHTRVSAANSNVFDIATDSAGNSYVVWDDFRNISADLDVFMQKFNTAGVKQWSEDIRVNTDNSSAVQRNPKVCLDAASAPIVIWEDTRQSEKIDVYAQFYDTNGQPLWPQEVEINKDDTGYATTDVTGLAIHHAYNKADSFLYITWSKYEGDDFDIYSQKISSVGIRLVDDWLISTTEAGGGFVSSAVAQSKAIYNAGYKIVSAKVFADTHGANNQSIRLFLSNNGGIDWLETGLNGSTCTFVSTGFDLRWKAEWSSADPFTTPLIYNVTIQYFVPDGVDYYNQALYVYDDTWHYTPDFTWDDNGWTPIWYGWGGLFWWPFWLTQDANNPDTGLICANMEFDPHAGGAGGMFVLAGGKWRSNGGTGIDLSRYSALSFRVRYTGVKWGTQFGIGNAGDSCLVWRNVDLSAQWTTVFIDLSAVDLSDVNNIFWLKTGAYRAGRNNLMNVYIDDIKFMKPGPPAITDLYVQTGETPGSVHLTWSAPGVIPGHVNTQYIVKYSTSYIYTQSDFDRAVTFPNTMVPAIPGQQEALLITDLIPGQTYYFAVLTRDDQGFESAFSNVFFATARTDSIGILVEGNIDLGEMSAGEIKVGEQPIEVTNIGGLPTTLSLSLTDPPGWFASLANDDANEFVMLGAFANNPLQITWDALNQALSTEEKKCTATVFAGEQTGVAIPVDDTRKLWIRFSAPSSGKYRDGKTAYSHHHYRRFSGLNV